MLKFYWNGIKDDNGKLQTCHYSAGMLIGHPAGTLTIYKREYSGFSAGVKAAFAVENDTDIQSDYIVRDVIRVEPDHPLYAAVLVAYESQVVHNAKRAQKQAERRIAAHA